MPKRFPKLQDLNVEGVPDLGTRKGAGRLSGGKNKATLEKEARAAAGVKAALDTGVMPLDVMLYRMRGTREVSDQQFEAAVAAAPYLHAKLSAVAAVAMDDLFKLNKHELRDELSAIDAELAKINYSEEADCH